MQQVLFPNVGSLSLINAIRLALADSTIHLFTNDITLSAATIKDNLTEAVFGGYVAKDVADMLPGYIDPAGGASSQTGTVQWDSDGFDAETVLGAWLQTAGTTATITDATNASPIEIETSAPHGLTTGDRVRVQGVTGNIAANGDWTIIVTAADTFTINGSTGDGAYVSGGEALNGYELIMAVKFEAGVAMAHIGDSLPLDLKVTFGA